MSSESIDVLYARWQQNPDAPETTALCEALCGQQRPDLVEIVGTHAARQLDVGTLVAAARMYVDSTRLDDAQSVLLAAGRIAPRDSSVYRWLGEVLLRRGDAERAERVLEKAIQLGANGGVESLLERARSLITVQLVDGHDAVADEIARLGVQPVPPSSPNLPAAPPASSPKLPGSRPKIAPVKTSSQNAMPAARRPSSSDKMTAVRPARPPSSDKMTAVKPPPSKPKVTPPLATSSGRRVGPLTGEVFEDESETMVRGATPIGDHPVESAIEAALGALGTSPLAAGAPQMTPPPPLALPPPSVPPPPLEVPRNMPPMPPADDLVYQTPTRGVGFEPHAIPDGAPVSGPALPSGDLGTFPKSAPQLTAPAATASFGQPSDVPAPPSSRRAPDAAREPPINPLLQKAKPVALDGSVIPEARDVLEALQVAGIYEADAPVGAQTFVWTKPEGVRRYFSAGTLVALAVLLVGGGIGSYFYVTKKRAAEHLVAERMVEQVDKNLAASDPKLLEPSEKDLSKVFELESRSPHAALTWLRERAMVGLLKGGADLAFEDAIQRAKEVGVEDKKIAFARVASFLFQSDTAGAASAVAKFDAIAQEDAWFMVISGATFERAGDQRALERYAAATKLDPNLLIARILLTRATAVDGDPRRAAELAKELRASYPDRVEGAALVALAWTRDPFRGEPPPEVKEVLEKGDALPNALRAVPHATRAVVALHRGALDEARPALQKGLDVVDSPGIAAWLGSIALAMGDEALARRAALAAVSFSAVYGPARVLAARVALLGARLDEALKATEDLPATSPDVAIVTAAASYEKLDGERVARAFDAVGEDPRKLPFGVPLGRGQALLAGNAGVMNAAQALDMADDEAPWADLVAMDWALDVGDLDLAKKIADPWKGSEARPMRAVRIARLARYEGRLEDADKASKVAIEGGTVTMRVLIERVLTLVALKRDEGALALFKAYPNVGGPLAKWLRAYAVAAHGKVDEARAIVSQEDPPPAAAPMPARIVAAMAFAMMRDARHGNEYVKPIVQAGFANPDVSFAAEKLGGGKVVRRVR